MDFTTTLPAGCSLSAAQNRAVYGTVKKISDNLDLIVELENGETGFVPASEASRLTLKPEALYRRILNHRLAFDPGATENGYRILSARAFEEARLTEIRSALESKERNVYLGKFLTIDAGGRNAYYLIEQGISVSVACGSFAKMWIEDLRAFRLPTCLPLVITKCCENGYIYAAASPAFGDFADNIQRLAIQPGTVLTGTAAASSNGKTIVNLAPNLLLRVISTGVKAGTAVTVHIDDVDTDSCHLKGTLVDTSANVPSMHFEEYCKRIQDMPTYIEMEEFNLRIGLRNKASFAAAPQKPEEPDYGINTDISPFRTCSGETVSRSFAGRFNPNTVLFENQCGYLNADTLLVAKAVNSLHYSTIYQIERYLHLTSGFTTTRPKLQNMLNRLEKLGIVNEMRLQDQVRKVNYRVFCPDGIGCFQYTNEARTLLPYEYTADLTPAFVKSHLAANQLLIGMLHQNPNGEVQDKPYLIGDISQKERIRIRPKKQLNRNNAVFYLEGLRTGSEAMEEFVDKLNRYKRYAMSTNNQFTVCVTVEADEELSSVAAQIEECQLPFPVQLTSDLHCLPDPVFQTIAAKDVEVKREKHSSLRTILRRLRGGVA